MKEDSKTIIVLILSVVVLTSVVLDQHLKLISLRHRIETLELYSLPGFHGYEQ